MSSESPFRISSTVLTVACILCGLIAVSYLVSQLTPRPDVVDQSAVAANALQVSLSEFQTTSLERSVSPSVADGHSVPHYYAPVTVHPVTVNIDNAGIIREISRMHQRLDSLGAEANSKAQSEAP